MPTVPTSASSAARRAGRARHAEAARRVGAALARDDLGLVYGGGRVGLMGVVADAALAAGGRIVGVIPDPLATRRSPIRPDRAARRAGHARAQGADGPAGRRASSRSPAASAPSRSSSRS